MFSRIFIEQDVADHQKTHHILKRFSNVPTKYIQNIDDVFGKVKKPYLEKRTNLQLFIGKKRGTLIKEAPDAYGLAGEKHFYFIHAYNCIYECEYCYLQGYFNSPDIVLFINHDEIMAEIEDMGKTHSETLWFHAGEFSDSLALSHLTGELSDYFKTFKKHPHLKLELRTKAVNITGLLEINPLPNVITSFSLSPEKRIKKTDLKTPSLSHRLKAMRKLQEAGHPIAIHLDPVIHEDNFEKSYEELFQFIFRELDTQFIEYLSIGVVRFTGDVYRQVLRNYPNSELHAAEFTTSFDGKVRYPRPFRLWILSKIKSIALICGFQESQIYLCME